MKVCATCGITEEEDDDIEPCADCDILLCYEDRRDFSKEILCPPCVRKQNEAYFLYVQSVKDQDDTLIA